MHGGKRKGAGRKAGPITSRVKMGISISLENAEWLRGKKKEGKNISMLIDKALDEYKSGNIDFLIRQIRVQDHTLLNEIVDRLFVR